MSEGLIIRRSAVQVRLPLPNFPYILQGYSEPSPFSLGSTGSEQSEHCARRDAQKSAHPVLPSFGLPASMFQYNSNVGSYP